MGDITKTFDGKDYTFSPQTQGVQESLEKWLWTRNVEAAMEAGEIYRRKARVLEREAMAIREADRAHGHTYGPAQAASLQAEMDDKFAEMQALQIEARELVSEVNRGRARGDFHFWGNYAREAKTKITTIYQLMWLSLRKAHATITMEDVQKLGEKHFQEMAIAMAQANGDMPKNESPEASIPDQARTASGNPSTESEATAKTTP